jgi:YVTN family beta-propeller protein
MKSQVVVLLSLSLFLSSCARSSEAKNPVVDRHIVPTRQVLRPAGESVEFGGRPVDLVLSPDEKALYVKDNRGLVVIETKTWKIHQELKFKSGGGSMHGITVNRDGSRVYATTAQNILWEGQVSAEDGKVSWSRQIGLPGPQGRGNSHACGIVLSPDEKIAYVGLSRNNTLGVVDLDSGKLIKEIPVGVAPFDVVLSPNAEQAYISNWGGRRARPGERTAKSSGTDTLVDERGIASSGTVSIVDLKQGREVAQVQADLHPSDLELSADGRTLYVANANSDTISVIDTVTRQSVNTISVRPDASLPFGSAPNALALSRDGKALYVANGGNNAIAVITLNAAEPSTSRVKGFIPTGWYPGGVATDGKHIYIANVKGLGSRNKNPNQSGWHVYWYLGTVNKVKIPSDKVLKDYSAQVYADTRVPQILRAWEKTQSPKKPVPVPEQIGDPSVFDHVVYVIKENRTYDQVFGNMAKGNNDPCLCIFGREVTPNHHALAEQFVLLDNYYCNGVNSADGHSWATEGNVTDHLEKSFGGFTRSYTFGDDPLTYSSSGFIWDNVLLHGLSFRNYGEMDYAEPIPKELTFKEIYEDFRSGSRKILFSQNIGIENLRRYSCREYPGWNMKIPDVLRAEVFLKELKEYEKKGSLPNFLIVYLPQDHTSGTSPGWPTPRAHVADNDLALGRVVEGISKSRFWPKTCIFVIEDDPQNGFDHVDGHRSVCLVISPYTKRGALVSNFYNQTSVLHTMERILGLPPMNQMDAMAPVMTACFTEKPDFRPYTALSNQIPLDEMNKKLAQLNTKEQHWARRSLEQNFEVIDGPDDDTLNRILWHWAKGVDTPYPAHLAGAHATGLTALNLILVPGEEDCGQGRCHEK